MVYGGRPHGIYYQNALWRAEPKDKYQNLNNKSKANGAVSKARGASSKAAGGVLQALELSMNPSPEFHPDPIQAIISHMFFVAIVSLSGHPTVDRDLIFSRVSAVCRTLV